jgi:hypothetical protein
VPAQDHARRARCGGVVPAGSLVAKVEGDGQGEHQRGAADVPGKEPGGLTEEVARRWGDRETSARLRSAVEEVQTMVDVAPRYTCGSARGKGRA